MITIIGIGHEYQTDEESRAPDIEADKHCYLELLSETLRTTGATLIGEEMYPDDSRSLAKKLAEERGVAYMVVDMNPKERLQHGIPNRYSDYDTRCTRAEIEKFHRLREQFMVERLLAAQTGDGNSILVCGSFHTYRLAALLWKRGFECDALTPAGAVVLENKEQLPNIPGDDDVYLTWDADYSEDNDRPRTVICNGDTVLFREPARWEAIGFPYPGQSRFYEICEILKQKYGQRVRDLVPTDPASMWLYGDKLAGPMFRAEIVDKVFGSGEEFVSHTIPERHSREYRVHPQNYGETTQQAWYDFDNRRWESRRQAWHDGIVDIQMNRCTPNSEGRAPHTIIFCGGKAAGKSELSSASLRQNENQAVLDIDLYKRAIWDNDASAGEVWKRDKTEAGFCVHEEASAMFKQALLNASNRGLDFIYDSTTGCDASFAVFRMLADKGYTLEAKAVWIPIRESFARAKKQLDDPNEFMAGYAHPIPEFEHYKSHYGSARNFMRLREDSTIGRLELWDNRGDPPRLVYEYISGQKKESVRDPEVWERYQGQARDAKYFESLLDHQGQSGAPSDESKARAVEWADRRTAQQEVVA